MAEEKSFIAFLCLEKGNLFLLLCEKIDLSLFSSQIREVKEFHHLTMPGNLVCMLMM